MSEKEQTKKSTIFYYEWNKLIKMLPDDKKLVLYETILSENPTRPEDEQTGCIFDFINDKLNENFDKYQDIRVKRKAAAEKRWGKNKPKKEATPKTENTTPKIKQNGITLESVKNMSKKLVKIFTKNDMTSFISHSDSDNKLIAEFIVNSSVDKSIKDDFDSMDSAYSKIRDYHIKNSIKSKEDEVTKTIHEQTSINSSSLRNLTADKGENEFYRGFWNNCKDKTITVMGTKYDINLSEQMFFLSGTKKTGNFGAGKILEEIWKLKKNKEVT